MNITFKFITLFCLLSSPLLSVDFLNFDQLQKLADRLQSENPLDINELKSHQSEIALRGFLAQTDSGQWLLMDRPNVRSCCLKRSKNIKRQISLTGNFSEKDLNRALTLKGTLNIDVQHDDDQKIQQFYTLTNAQRYPKNQKRLPLTFLMLLGGTTLCGTIYVRNKVIHAKRQK